MQKFARLPATHAVFLGLILVVTGFILWSALDASRRLDNLIVVVPAALVLVMASAFILFSERRNKDELAATQTDNAEEHSKKALWGDILLLVGFAAFCMALTRIGFDIATFIFVWGGVVMSGAKGKWQPPLYAALFTLFLVKGFGSLFPYPMLTWVL